MNSHVAEEPDPLCIDDQLCFALYSVSRAITKEYAPLLESMGVTYPQYLTLLVLWQRDNVPVRTIARSLEIDAATATPLVQRLERLGLVVRERSAEDERQVLVRLTPKGRGFREQALKIPHGLGCALGVDEKTARRLIREANKIKAFIAARDGG